MKKNQNFINSLLVSTGVCLIFLCLLSFSSFFLNIKFIYNSYLTFVCVLLLFFVLTFILIHFTLRYFFSKSIKKIIEEFYSNEYDLHDKKKSSSLDTLTISLRKFAEDKKLEIEVLKSQENYRKEFIGNLSHELKTPIFTVQSYILTLIEGGYKDSGILLKYLKSSSKGLDRLTCLVKDLDLINQFESGIKNIKLNNFNIVELINSVFELLEMQSRKNNISLVFDSEYSKSINVIADKDRIQQVITNLVVNSIKYGVDNGTTEISILDLNADKLIIRITDNGLGIAKEHLPRLFERFYRVDKSGSREKGGSGLGLAIVKHIIEAHNEKVFVESSEGIGSEFSFTLQKANISKVAKFVKKNKNLAK